MSLSRIALAPVECGQETLENYVFAVILLSWSISGEVYSQDPAIRSRIVRQISQALGGESNTTIEVSPEFRAMMEDRLNRLFDPARGERNSFNLYFS